MTSLFWNLLTAETPGAKTIGKNQYLELFLRVTKVCLHAPSSHPPSSDARPQVLMPNWTETESRALVEVERTCLTHLHSSHLPAPLHSSSHAR